MKEIIQKWNLKATLLHLGLDSEDIKHIISEVENQKKQYITDYHNHIVEKIKCGECNGSGAYSSPYDYSPCRHCDGTGFNIINGCFNDILQDTNPKE